MLRQVFIIKDDEFLFERNFGKPLNNEEYYNLFVSLKGVAFGELATDFGNYEYGNFRITYIYDESSNIFIIFITGLYDGEEDIKAGLVKFKDEFFNLFSDDLLENADTSLLEVLNPLVDSIQKNLIAKISLVGFPGVGKTTITKLIKEEAIPSVHIPTITGNRTTIKIGKLVFSLLDFAGQEQFSYLWKSFIKGSDAVLIITDSTLENVEKSKFFLDLIRDEAPNTFAAVIGNKQDLPGALSVESIESHLNLKTYSMVAIEPNNRTRMIQIISDVLEISPEVSPLLKPLYERDELLNKAQHALEQGDYSNALIYFEKIADICLDLGDDSLGRAFYEKAEELKTGLNNQSI